MQLHRSTAPPAPHLLIRGTCISSWLIDCVFKIRTWTHSGEDCVLRHASHSSLGLVPACLLSTLAGSDLLLKPAFLDYLLAFCPWPQTLDLPSCCRLCLFWSFPPQSSSANFTCFHVWLRDCRSLLTIDAVNKSVVFHWSLLHSVPTLDPDIHKSVQ